MIKAVPVLIPVTIPDVEPTVALDELLLHVPPASVLLSVALPPTQYVVVPVLAGGTVHNAIILTL